MPARLHPRRRRAVRRRPGARRLGRRRVGLRRRGGRRRRARRASAAPSSCATRATRRAEIAYGAHPWARGRGIMHRALELLLAWGFEEQGLRTVIWWANRGNWASRRTAWRLGFTLEGTVPQWLPQRGELLDAWVGVLRAGDERAPRTDWLVAPRVDGEQVSLRPWRPDDADADRARRAPTSAPRHWLWRLPSPYTRADAEDYLASPAGAAGHRRRGRLGGRRRRDRRAGRQHRALRPQARAGTPRSATGPTRTPAAGA